MGKCTLQQIEVRSSNKTGNEGFENTIKGAEVNGKLIFECDESLFPKSSLTTLLEQSES